MSWISIWYILYGTQHCMAWSRRLRSIMGLEDLARCKVETRELTVYPKSRTVVCSIFFQDLEAFLFQFFDAGHPLPCLK